jgi:hypothetical protein
MFLEQFKYSFINLFTLVHSGVKGYHCKMNHIFNVMIFKNFCYVLSPIKMIILIVFLIFIKGNPY